MSYKLALLKKVLKKYLIHMFGIVAFFFTLTLSIIALYKHSEFISELLPYGVVVFVINVFYLKIMRLSREDYEEKLKKEKVYSQKLLRSQKYFLRNAVHETNTPIAVIMANIELYEMEFGKNNILSNIEAATKNIYGIYDDLSYLTKIDSVNFLKQKIDLKEYIKTRLEFFDILAKQSNLSFEFFSTCKYCMVLINEIRLQRIVDNNITNAIKYTKEFKNIYILIYELEDTYVFDISSNSIMIEKPERIFNEYRRESYIKDGLGLGLTLVKTICEEESIKIELKSNEHLTSFKYFFNKYKPFYKK